MILPKLILTDIDGVWTDGGMFYDKENLELKKFNTYDSAGVLFCKLLNIPVGIITGENTNIVKRRAEKLKIDFLYLGSKNKIKDAQEIIDQLGITWKEVAFLGDDINDILLLRKVGVAGVVKSAPEYVKKEANLIVNKNGGDGAFREFVEVILKENSLLDKALEIYLEGREYDQ